MAFRVAEVEEMDSRALKMAVSGVHPFFKQLEILVLRHCPAALCNSAETWPAHVVGPFLSLDCLGSKITLDAKDICQTFGCEFYFCHIHFREIIDVLQGGADIFTTIA